MAQKYLLSLPLTLWSAPVYHLIHTVSVLLFHKLFQQLEINIIVPFKTIRQETKRRMD